MNALKNIIFCLILSVIFIACSDNKEEKVESKIEKYEFIESKQDSKKIIITLPNESKDSIRLKFEASLGDKPKILAFFSKDCKHCTDILPHINNLATTHKNAIIVALNQNGNTINDSTFLRQEYFLNLQEVNNAFFPLLDSIKRRLNIEIRDFNAPIFFILDKQDSILKSLEGLVTQEMLEYEIQKLEL